MQELDALIGIKKVSEWLHLTPQTVKKFCREGKISCLKIGKAWRFNQEELNDWIKTQNSRNE